MKNYSFVSKIQEQFEELRGLKLLGVSYYHFVKGEVISDQHYHIADFAVVLEFEEEKHLHFAWYPHLEHYQPGIGNIPFNEDYPECEMTCNDMTASKFWQEYTGKVLKAIDISWDWIRRREGKKYYFASDLVLTFEDGDKLTMAVGELDDLSEANSKLESTPGGDLYLIFSESLAAKWQRGSYRKASLYATPKVHVNA